MTAKASACSDLLQYFERMAQALVEVRANYQRVTLQPGPYFGLSQLELDETLGDLRSTLDGQVVVAMSARAEALLRTDLEARLRGRLKAGGVLADFKELHEAQPNRKRLNDILTVWRTAVGEQPFKFQEVGRLRRQRHWLAHGQYWTLMTGAWIDPLGADFIIEELFDAIRQVDPEFPR